VPFLSCCSPLGLCFLSANIRCLLARVHVCNIYKDLIGVARKAPVIALSPSFLYLYKSLVKPCGSAKLSIVSVCVIKALYPRLALPI
jgi:hypothetical protein